MKKLILGSGLLRRGETLLLVRGRYPDEPSPLWTLPGGRQKRAEMLTQTVTREFLEETSLPVRLTGLAYVSESVNDDLHVLNCTFWVDEENVSADVMPHDAKIVEARFVPVDRALELLRADVLRIPVTNALRQTSEVRYYDFRPEDIRVPFFHARAGKR